MIKKAPGTFVSLVFIFSLVGSGMFYWFFNWQMWNVLNMKNTLVAEMREENDRLKSRADIKQHTNQAAVEEKKELTVITGRTFSNEQVLLDGFSYQNCTFIDVVFLFNGGPGETINCTLKAGHHGFLTFSKPVERTVKVLHMLSLLRPGVTPQMILGIKSSP